MLCMLLRPGGVVEATGEGARLRRGIRGLVGEKPSEADLIAGPVVRRAGPDRALDEHALMRTAGGRVGADPIAILVLGTARAVRAPRVRVARAGRVVLRRVALVEQVAPEEIAQQIVLED